jgi:hypothetical protein
MLARRIAQSWFALVLAIFVLAFGSAGIASAGDPGAPSIDLEKTVGTVPGVCADTSEIFIPAPAEVTYCYRITNTGNTPFTNITLVDDRLGPIDTTGATPLLPGETYTTLETAVINVTTTNTATVVASSPYVTPDGAATDSDSATVNVQPPTAVTLGTVEASGSGMSWPVALVGLLLAGTAGAALRRWRR